MPLGANASPHEEADRLRRLAFGSHTTLVASPPIDRLARSAEAERVTPSRWPSTRRRWDPRDGLCGRLHRETRQKSRTWMALISRRTTREWCSPDWRVAVHPLGTVRRRLPFRALLPNEPAMRS